MKTRSIRYLPQGGLEVVTLEVGDPGPGQVQVRGSACGICAWDLNTFRSGSRVTWAAPPGHEGLGRVVRVGAGVTGFQEGDRVAAGGFGGLANVNASSTYHLPESDLEDVYWLVEPLACVVTGVDHCALKIGDRVAVVGCGFMGLLLVQCLAHSFAERLIASDVSPERLALASQFGADGLLNPLEADVESKIAALRALEIDTVVDASGSQAGFALTQRLVKRGGRINNFGWIHGEVTISGDAWHMNGYTVVNSSPAARLRDPFPASIRLLAANMVDTKPLVTHVVTLDEMGALLSGVAAGQEPGYIKGVVTLDGE
jgi:threonine dehydrogenase-like Zn-dependent dehydrogenase